MSYKNLSQEEIIENKTFAMAHINKFFNAVVPQLQSHLWANPPRILFGGGMSKKSQKALELLVEDFYKSYSRYDPNYDKESAQTLTCFHCPIIKVVRGVIIMSGSASFVIKTEAGTTSYACGSYPVKVSVFNITINEKIPFTPFSIRTLKEVAWMTKKVDDLECEIQDKTNERNFLRGELGLPWEEL